MLSLSLSSPVYAYIDPGTTGNVFAILAPFIALFIAFLGFVIRPFRLFFTSIINKFQGNPGAEPPAGEGQQEPGDSADNEESEKNQNEETPS